MSQLVPHAQIEAIVGVSRHEINHYARAVSAEQTVYILHSWRCLESGRDLLECEYSLALDRGIDVESWAEDVPVPVAIDDGRLVPAF